MFCLSQKNSGLIMSELDETTYKLIINFKIKLKIKYLYFKF